MPFYRAHPARDVINDFGARLAIEETRITLFVCGPTPSGKPSAILRKFISTEITKKIRSATVVWGEHRDFRGLMGKNIQLRKFIDVTKELHFARNESDLVIIFPDSPGSFVELGIFGMHPRNKDGSASLKEKHFVFSPKQFVETLDPILKSLSGVCSGLEEYRQQLADAKTGLAAYAQDDYSPGDYAQRFISLKLQLDLIITITSEPIGVSELLFPSRQQSRQDWPSGDPTDPLAAQPNRSIP
jgi:hypothetical protein